MFLDYLIVPLICTMYGSLTVQRLLPQVPYGFWVALFAGSMTLINLHGIRTTSRTNLILLVADHVVVVLAFIGEAVHFFFRHQGWHGDHLDSTFLQSGNVSLVKHGVGDCARRADLWRI